ncbi:MAG: Uma2 family endonuclease [Chloroflexi bacterium]|nr:Uma2 family endonuclease [Chloroflexota bacterium]
MSPNTRNYDRGDKFQRYRTFDSLEIYLLIDQHKIYVEYFEKQADGTWQLRILTERSQEIVLAGLDIRVKVGELYEGKKVRPRIYKKHGITSIPVSRSRINR